MSKLIPAPPIEVHDDGVHCGENCHYLHLENAGEIWCDSWDRIVRDEYVPPGDGSAKEPKPQRCQACLDHEKAEEEKQK